MPGRNGHDGLPGKDGIPGKDGKDGANGNYLQELFSIIKGLSIKYLV